MTDLNRVIKVIDWLIFAKKIKSRRELAEKMGYNESSLSQILNGKVSLSERFINKLSVVDYSINTNWLFTGEGNMLKDTASSDNVMIDSSLIKDNEINYGLDSQIKALAQEIEHLKSLLLEKDKQLTEKERLLVEKDRLIDVLMTKP